MSERTACVKCQIDDDGVATLIIDRAERRNSLSAEVIDGLLGHLAALRGDASARVVVLTGAGERAFCAGGDLAGGMGGAAKSAGGRPAGFPGRIADAGGFVEVVRALAGLGKPVIARLNGDALGGGVGLMLACHLVVAADDARVGLPEINVGLWPMMVTALLVRHVGRKVAAELMLIGDKLPAARAQALGLINRVVPRESLDEEVAALARKLAGRSNAVMRLGLDALENTADLPLDSALWALRDRLVLNLMLEDAAEGVGAFLQKRPPQWKDR